MGRCPCQNYGGAYGGVAGGWDREPRDHYGGPYRGGRPRGRDPRDNNAGAGSRRYYSGNTWKAIANVFECTARSYFNMLSHRLTQQ